MRTAGLRLDQAPPLHLPLRFFLTAPLFTMAAGALLALRGASLLAAPWPFPTLALTHLLTLGTLSMVMMGALYQITPVLVGVRVSGMALIPLVHLGLSVGVATFEGWLLGVGGWLLAVALPLLTLSFAVFLGQMALSLIRAPRWNPTVVSIALAVGALAGVAVLGLLFAGEYAGYWPLRGHGALAVLHIYLALGLWISALISGVSYAVIPMFYLSGHFPRWVRLLVPSLLPAVPLGGFAVAWLGLPAYWHLLPLGVGTLAMGVFVTAFWRAMLTRRRRVGDATLRFWQLGMTCLPVALLAAVAHTLWPSPRMMVGFGALFLAGFALSVVSGMLLKIVAFLVWLHRFSHQAGKAHVPLIKDIITDRAAMRCLWAYLAALALLFGAVATGAEAPARLAGIALTVFGGAMWWTLLRAARFNPLPQDGADNAAPPPAAEPPPIPDNVRPLRP